VLSLLVAAGALTALIAGIAGAWSPCGFSMVDTIGTALGGRDWVRRSTATSAIASSAPIATYQARRRAASGGASMQQS